MCKYRINYSGIKVYRNKYAYASRNGFQTHLAVKAGLSIFTLDIIGKKNVQ